MTASRERLGSVVSSDRTVLVGLVALAAAMRLPGILARGPWDADQGENMLAVREAARGVIPLLGAPSSTGGLHHGPMFDWLGAIVSLPSGGDDPSGLLVAIALGGIGAVAATWWLGRIVGGPVAGLVAGLLAVVSAQMVDASVRLWNPAFVAPAAAIALAAAWEAHRRLDPRWWAVAAAGLVVAGQSHLLAWVLVAPLGILAVGDARGRDRRTLRWLAVAAAIVVVSFVPLAIHEATTGFGELRAVLAAESTGADTSLPLAVRALFVPFRVATVPLVGQVLLSLPATVCAFALVVGAAVVAGRRGPTAPGTRWLAAGLAIGAVALAIGAPWLSTVTPLFVDHYHLALDPIVFALAGLGAGVLWQAGRGGRATVAVAVAAVVAWNLVVVPLPPVNADGGWPAGLAAGRRVAGTVGDGTVTMVGSPPFKQTTAVGYVLTALGKAPVAPGAATYVAVVCDDLFKDVVGAACQGAAEANALAAADVTAGPLVDRFEAAPGRWISVFRLAGR